GAEARVLAEAGLFEVESAWQAAAGGVADVVVRVEALEFRGLGGYHGAAQTAVVGGGGPQGRTGAVALVVVGVGLVEAGQQAAAELVDDGHRGGLGGFELVQARQSGPGQAGPGAGLLAGGVLRFQGDPGPADDRGQGG